MYLDGLDSCCPLFGFVESFPESQNVRQIGRDVFGLYNDAFEGDHTMARSTAGFNTAHFRK